MMEISGLLKYEYHRKYKQEPWGMKNEASTEVPNPIDLNKRRQA